VSALLAKELRELWRSKRVLILPLLFIAIGITGPALIRLIPILLEQTPGTIGLELPDFGPADGLAQYLELARQMGLLAVLLVYMGILAGERRDGLLAFLFVKPVSRLTYVSVRWATNGTYVLASFAVGAGVAAVYTLLLLGAPDYGAMAQATLLYLTYVLLAFSWVTLFSALSRSPALAAGLSLLPLFVLPVLGALWDPLGTYGPYGAVAAGTARIGAAEIAAQPVPPSALASAGLNIALSVLLVLGAYRALRNAEL
jgi:ABC-2 type transport system permease protein